MKRTGTRFLALGLALALTAFFALAGTAEARVGGGRSSGSRGSRGMAAPRTYQAPAAPRNNFGNGNFGTNAPNRPMGGYAPQASSGGWMRSLGAGLAGGFLGSMLFRGVAGAGGMGGMGGGGGGFGLLELLLLGVIGYVVYRIVKGRRQLQSAGGPADNYTSYSGYGQDPSSTATTYPAAVPDLTGGSAEDPTEVLRRHDPQFDTAKFREERLDDFFQLQAAFGNRDLTPVLPRLTPEMAQLLGEDVRQLKASGRVNRLDNIAVRDVENAEAWHESGRVFATVRFRANLVDYTVDERTGEVVAGSRTESVKFHELWTFVKDIGFAAQSPRWRLSAIEQEST